MRSLRVKQCDRCVQPFPVLYRIRYESSGQWRFVCEPCLLKLREDNPHYAYGGTWKARKRRS
ncbi:hypothetical protein C7B61_11060 [filamentous cyanobacterium CCP1]|nr:hypothetical protein C7B76_07285 [filamentous cyanobacterium CCP2]PSB65676.1 hypothetical protein C7B61_11060 [filamentous cyanobacterium CCP1]